ncbi:MAG: hypothetical protein NTW62_03645 [Candidatus Nomurabacteria bacterium]|nr:hypothetical protein [Candidatus Nomurabacteria bacterium]
MKNKLFLIIILIVAVFSVGQKAHAASLYLIPDLGTYNIDDTVTVGVFVSTTNDKSINAISGEVTFPEDKLNFVNVSKVGSIVNVWTTEPFKETNDVRFEGIVLNPGYNGTKGKIATITFKAKNPGVADLAFISSSVLANDGLGTNLLDKTGIAKFTINKTLPSIKANPVLPKPKKDSGLVNATSTPMFTITPVPTMVEVDLPYKQFTFTISNLVKPIASYNIAIDRGNPIIWNDDGTGIYTTPELESGNHTLVVEAVDTDGNKLVNSIDFTVSALKKPIIKMSNQALLDGDFLVISGTATSNQNVDIYIKSQLDNSDDIYNILLGKTSFIQADFEKVGTSLTDKNGLFTFVYDNRIKNGVYSVYVISRTDNNIESKPSDTVLIHVDKNSFQKILTLIFRALVFFLLPFIGLLTLLKLIISFFSKIYTIYKRHKESTKIE